MKGLLGDALFVVGLALVVYGISLVYVPAAVIVAGGMLAFLSTLLERGGVA